MAESWQPQWFIANVRGRAAGPVSARTSRRLADLSLSPHYLGDPATAKVVPKSRWYEAPAQEPRVMDLMAALKASVEATKQGKKAPAARPAASRAAKVKVAAKTSAARPAAKRRTA